MHALAVVAILMLFLNGYREPITSKRGRSTKEAEADRYAAPALSVAKIHQSRALEVPVCICIPTPLPVACTVNASVVNRRG